MSQVCFINMPIEYYSPVSGGAIATVIRSVGGELETRGHNVSVLSRVNGDAVYPVGRVIPIEVKERDDLNFLQRRVSSLRRRLSQWDWPWFEYYLDSVKRKLAAMSPAPDAVVVCNDLVSPYHLKRMLPRTKVIVWMHNEWRTRFDMAKTIASADLFVTCSEYIRRWMMETHGIPAERIAAGWNGVDHGAFKPEPARAKGDELKVLFLGRIDPNKGPDLAADAVAALRREGLPVRLTVAGGLWFYGHGNEMRDPYFRELKSKMDAANAEYLGHVTRERVPELVRGHDVVCVLSRSTEPFGLVVLEAMASGCAVIASARGGLPEACGGAALVADPDDFPGIVAALRSLVTDRELLDRQKRKSLERAARSSWAGCADVFERAIAPDRREAFAENVKPAAIGRACMAAGLK